MDDDRIPLTARRNASQGYRRLPEPPVSEHKDLVVVLRCPPGAQRTTIIMWGKKLQEPRTGMHTVELAKGRADLTAQCAQLIAEWQRFVDYEPSTTERRTREAPYTHVADLSGRPDGEVEENVAELAWHGARFLTRLLEGHGRVASFRDQLLALLRHQDLRIRFDSDVAIPWQMLALPSGPETADPPREGDAFHRFLGHRHQIETTSPDTYDMAYWYEGIRSEHVSSINANESLMEKVPKAKDLADLLARRTRVTERFTRAQLLKDLRKPVLDEDIMYFFCHGGYEFQGGHSWHSLRLSDPAPLDPDHIDGYRSQFTESAQDSPVIFHPLVLLNVCSSGAPGNDGSLRFASVFVKHGAVGVLAPHISMPQNFGAEFALKFLEHYVVERRRAGEAAQNCVHWFAKTYRNPLALAYSLCCGLDTRLPATTEEASTA
ncbi:hypothetical protein [Streptomyces sp. CRCS-T-1]|uniref:hypothetical protein n=1 Tax=Streptomyces sp. CRCS-T-1 TaxID=2964607 RepID=UPI00210E648D|nr:hypothetical protein [Streptomyces sp. CRCS-T-1]UUA18033.1 hypothetical protein NNW99_34775 [Streptomyces sp. CRCS-T-1]